jgi:hypothetical protein
MRDRDFSDSTLPVNGRRWDFKFFISLRVASFKVT